MNPPAARRPVPHRPARLDQILVRLGLCESREKAQRSILAGRVFVNHQRARKPSDAVRVDDHIELALPERYVSRGGLKLEHALSHFGLDVAGKTAIDVGASTGGFTDCLLQHHARHVYAVDVGMGQLAWKLRRDPRVTVLEQVNARHLRASHFPPSFVPADLAVIDCSFISLHKILPPVAALLKTPGCMIALVKPQFEAGKAEVDKGEGVILDPLVHQRVLEELRAFMESLPHWQWAGLTESPLRGPAGNKEFLVWLRSRD
jgi:23S rRNA (cytidine1920-2'-O)/16S rRNA (cytidine1409-2'-O)-methyltransferase